MLDGIKAALWEAKKSSASVSKIHVTHDFYMRLLARCHEIQPKFDDVSKQITYPILGHTVIEHYEPCKKEWWLELEN